MMYFTKLIFILFISKLINEAAAACLPTDICQYTTFRRTSSSDTFITVSWKYVCNGTEYLQYTYHDTKSCVGQPSSITKIRDTHGITSDAELTECNLECNNYIIFKKTMNPSTFECPDIGSLSYNPLLDTKEIVVAGCVNTGYGNSKLFQCNNNRYFREDSYEFEDCQGNIIQTYYDTMSGCHPMIHDGLYYSNDISFQCIDA